MSSPDDSVPEPIPDRPAEATGEVSMLPPDEAQTVIEEIRAVAESRGDDSEVVELVELPATGEHQAVQDATVQVSPELEEALSVDELRDAWPLLDLDERGDGLRVLPREDAEEFFIALNAVDQAALLLHFRPGQRRQWMRLLEPDDVADVIQQVDDAEQRKLL